MSLRTPSWILRNCALAALYAAIAWGSLRLFATLNASASPVWPPTGLALAALVLAGNRLAPGVFLGAFVANLLTAGTVTTSVAIAAGNALEAVAGAYLVRRFAKGRHAFDDVRHLALFVLAVALASLISATIGVTTLFAADLVPRDAVWAVWSTWWIGDAVGALVVTPPLLIFSDASARRLQGRVTEAVGLAMFVLVGALAIFGPLLRGSGPAAPLSFVVLPLVVWAAARFGSRGAASATALIASVAAWGTLTGQGPFAGLDPNVALVFLQAFVAVVATTGLALGAVVSERESAQAAFARARQAEQRFQTFVQSAPDAAVISDAEGRVVTVNAEAMRMFGYTRDEFLQLKVEDLMPPRFRGGHVGHRAGYHATPRLRPMGAGRELFAQRKDGTEFPVEISLGPLETDGGLLVSSSIRDISARKAAETELESSRRQVAVSEKLAALGTMVSGVGHEVRTPLTYISMNLALIRRQFERMAAGEVDAAKANSEMERYVAKCQEGIERIDRIIQELRRFAKAPLQVEPALIEEVVGHAVDLFRAVRRGQIDVVADLPEGPPARVDKGQIQQVVLNLLNNGADAMENQGTLEVRVRHLADGTEVDVVDRGHGIPPDVQGRLFDPFFTTKAEGTGLGLSITRRIVEAHGGSLRYVTGPHGTTFTVYLPRASTLEKEAIA